MSDPPIDQQLCDEGPVVGNDPEGETIPGSIITIITSNGIDPAPAYAGRRRPAAATREDVSSPPGRPSIPGLPPITALVFPPPRAPPPPPPPPPLPRRRRAPEPPPAASQVPEPPPPPADVCRLRRRRSGQAGPRSNSLRRAVTLTILSTPGPLRPGAPAAPVAQEAELTGARHTESIGKLQPILQRRIERTSSAGSRLSGQ